jgi:hypothetical protein
MSDSMPKPPSRSMSFASWAVAKGFVWFVFVYGGVFIAGSLLLLSVLWFGISLWLYGASARRPIWVESPMTTVAAVWLGCVVLAAFSWLIYFLWQRFVGQRRGA